MSNLVNIYIYICIYIYIYLKFVDEEFVGDFIFKPVRLGLVLWYINH